MFKLTPTLLVPDLLVLFVAPERRGQNAHVTCDRSLENATFRNLSAFHQIVRLSQHYARFKAVAKFTTLSAFDNSASNVSHTHWMVGYRHVFFILCFIDTLERPKAAPKAQPQASDDDEGWEDVEDEDKIEEKRMAQQKEKEKQRKRAAGD